MVTTCRLQTPMRVARPPSWTLAERSQSQANAQTGREAKRGGILRRQCPRFSIWEQRIRRATWGVFWSSVVMGIIRSRFSSVKRKMIKALWRWCRLVDWLHRWELLKKRRRKSWSRVSLSHDYATPVVMVRAIRVHQSVVRASHLQRAPQSPKNAKMSVKRPKK